MLNRIVGWFVLIPLAAILVIFALANRQLVVVNFNPFNRVELADPSYGMPLFLVIYAVLFVGIALGGAAVWFGQGLHRREEKRYRKEAERLRAELDRTRQTPRQERDPALIAADELR